MAKILGTAGMGLDAGSQLGRAFVSDQIRAEHERDPGSWVSVARFSDRNPHLPNQSGPFGASWMLGEDIMGMPLDEIRDTYGIPDGLLPGTSLTDPGGSNDMGYITIGWVRREDLENRQIFSEREALPWPPSPEFSPRSDGGGRELLLGRGVDARTVIFNVIVLPTLAE